MRWSLQHCIINNKKVINKQKYNLYFEECYNKQKCGRVGVYILCVNAYVCSVCMYIVYTCVNCPIVCEKMQLAAAFARMFKKDPFKEIAFNFTSSRQLWEDLWRGI